MPAHSGFVAEERSFLRGEMIDAQTLRSFRNWYPVTFCDQTGEIYWRDMGNQRFIESFFQNSLNAQPQDQRRICKTPVDALAQITDSVAPTAFIFHVSRCGSTLLTQMLSHLPHCIVLSEPPAIDAFFRHYQESSQKNILLFQHLIATLGQRRSDQEKHFIVKFDSWHIGRLDFIRQAFPQTPMIFLYRDPQQVLASHQRQRGPQMIPGLVDMGDIKVDQTAIYPGDLDAYCLRVLDQFYDNAISQHKKHHLQLLNYHELPTVIWESLLSQLNIQLTTAELAQVKLRSKYHSKHPQQNFHGDTTACIQHAMSEKARELYLQLELLRQQAHAK